MSFFHPTQNRRSVLSTFFQTFTKNIVQKTTQLNENEVSNELNDVASGFYHLGEQYFTNRNRPSILRSGRGFFSRIPLAQFLQGYPDFATENPQTSWLTKNRHWFDSEPTLTPVLPKPKEKDVYETLQQKTKGQQRRELEDAYKTLHHLPHTTKHTVKKTGYRYRTLAEREKGHRSLY